MIPLKIAKYDRHVVKVYKPDFSTDITVSLVVPGGPADPEETILIANCGSVMDVSDLSAVDLDLAVDALGALTTMTPALHCRVVDNALVAPALADLRARIATLLEHAGLRVQAVAVTSHMKTHMKTDDRDFRVDTLMFQVANLASYFTFGGDEADERLLPAHPVPPPPPPPPAATADDVREIVETTLRAQPAPAPAPAKRGRMKKTIVRDEQGRIASIIEEPLDD